jgi:hypothetical protein
VYVYAKRFHAILRQAAPAASFVKGGFIPSVTHALQYRLRSYRLFFKGAVNVVDLRIAKRG